MVKQGDTLASLDVVDYQNRLRSAEADESASEAALVESQSAEARLGKLLKNGWTPQANYDVALRNLRSAEAKLAAVRATLDLTRDQLNYTELKADFDGVITSVETRAVQISNDLAQVRFLLFVESENLIAKPFLAVLAFWLMIIFASFSLFSPLNGTVFACLFLFALSAASAIFLIMELSRPFTGLMMISSAPLRNALGTI